jgi:hypothetical protein
MLITKKLKVKWFPANKKHYIECGYIFTNYGDEFEIDVNDLSNGSVQEVTIQCDYCRKLKQIIWKDYLHLRGNTYCCPECLTHKKKTRDENGNLIFVEIPYRNKDWLYSEYIVKGRDANDIAKECGINQRTLREWISYFQLNNKYKSKTEKLTKDVIEDLYFKQHKTSEEIGDMYGLTGNTVINVIRSYGYQIPNRSELLSIYYNEKDGYEKVRLSQSTMENRIKSSCRQRGISVEDFDGFSTTEQHMARNNTYYKEWQRKVFKRDSYTCQCCGKRGGNLNAHHLYNFAEYENLRYEVTNGTTLCEPCHLINYPNSFHSIYGERNNTPEQIYEYIEMRKQEAV